MQPKRVVVWKTLYNERVNNSISIIFFNDRIYIMSLYDNIENETVTREIRITDKDKVMCEEYGHPRVYIDVKSKGFGVCGYCNITYKHTDTVQSEQIRKIIKKV